MNVLSASRFAALLIAVLGFSAAQVSAQSACDNIASDVASAIQKDPSKTLMIVEDALVINESCACEIIKAAIQASQADSALVNQIVQTGIAVAPKMSGVIMDCASALSPSAGVAPASVPVDSYDPTASGKNPDKNPLPVIVESEPDFILSPSIRGVYLFQPPPTGFVPCDPKFRKCCNKPVSPCNCTP